MDSAAAEDRFQEFLAGKEDQMDLALAMVGRATRRLSQGWAFYYQSKAYVETGDFQQSLVGHGLVVVCDDGRIIEGGSLDHDPEALLMR